MAVPGEPHDEALRGLYDHAAAALPPGASWFDAHTHTGHNDPDGRWATAAEIMAGLDRAGQQRALVFPLAEPELGYSAANDRVLAEAAGSGGRLIALARLDPRADPLPEARRCLDGGARGFKLHPRAERFTLDEPAVAEIVALAHERRLPVLIHAGRGIPALGVDALALARRYPGARLILAHAGISDLGLLVGELDRVPNVFFDTAWWNIADTLALFAGAPPGRILYGSDMPYGAARFSGMSALRAGMAVGLAPDALASVAGAQLARLVAGEEPLDLGPPAGAAQLARHLAADRVVAHLTGAVACLFQRSSPAESLALAELACAVPDEDPVAPLLATVAGLLVLGQEMLGQAARDEQADPRAAALPLIAAGVLAGTPGVGVPDPPAPAA